MIKRLFIFFCIILALTLIFSSVVIAQENESLGYAQIVYQWGEISVEEQFSVMADRPYKIGVSVPHCKSSFWINNAYGIFEEAEKTGCKSVTFLAAKGYDDLSTQISQVENLVELGVDAILIAPISSGGNVESCEEAIKKGVPIFFLEQNCYIRNHSGQVIGNDYQIGQMQAEWTAHKLGGEGKVILLSGPAATNWTTVNYQGILAGFSGYPGIEIVGQKWSDVDPAIGMEVTERYMMMYPDVDAFLCADVLAHGCAQAIKAAGKEDEILVVMNYPESATLPMIEEGLIDYSVINPPVRSAKILISIVNRVLNDTFDKIAGATLFIEPIEITPENVNDIDFSSEILSPIDWNIPLGGTEEWK